MMKRSGVPRMGPDDPSPLPPQNTPQMQQPGVSSMHTLPPAAPQQILAGATTMLSVGGFGRSRPAAPAVINYLKAGVQYAPKPAQALPPRHKFVPQAAPPPLPPLPAPLERQSPAPQPLPPPSPAAPAQFQRLKVEDALSYLDQVKFKFNTQPQVYNDFLDIMKEFKSQTIDTPGVITRVSNLFKGHPELIVGFNTFLPPGYKIEVQSNGQVQVSMPSPTGLGGGGGVLLGVHHTPQTQLVQLLPVPQSVSSAIVHNLTVNPTTNALHQISQAHQQIEAAAIHHASTNLAGGMQSNQHATAPPGQPVEFNHAIEYVNKIKSRFARQPDKYKRFLEILHAYQRGHRDVKEPQAKQQTEQEVYSQVAKLFENQEDLLAEFGQFLPDAKAVTKPPYTTHPGPEPPLQPTHQRTESESDRYSAPPSPPHPTIHLPQQQVPKHQVSAPPQHHHLKRSPSFTSTTHLNAGPPAKKSRVVSSLTGAAVRDVSYAEAAKYATHSEYNFFDRVRKALRSQQVYENFLRCLLLFTNEIVSSSEVLCLTAPFLCRHPELQRWLHDFVGPPSPPHTPTHPPEPVFNSTPFPNSSTARVLNYERERERINENNKLRYEPLGALGAQLRNDRPQGDIAMDIDLTTCKRLGKSYCALPREAATRKCSGRTTLCKEVLNDTWVSFPTWSEDSTFITSRKTQYEEYIYRCEDERFELDVVIETNAATIRVLEGVQKKLTRMSSEEAGRYRLDECLGGHSPTIHQRALRRIYGDKAVDIIAGLKKNPAVAVPVVLRRLKAKEEEWREAQKGFNKQWREQNEKYYLKSLDHQGINFKQNDLKAMRSKTLFNEVEAAYAAKKPGPHVVVDYNMTSRQEAIKIVRDAAELLIHHARRQTAIQKAEKRRIKQLVRQFIPDLLGQPRQPLSDDEGEEEDKEEPASPESPSAAEDKDKSTLNLKQERQESSESDNASEKNNRSNNKIDKENKPKNNNNSESKDSISLNLNSLKRSSFTEDKSDPDLEDDLREHPPNVRKFICTSSWYLFLRLHGTLCQRLGALRRAALALQAEEEQNNSHCKPSVASALRMKPSNLPPDAKSPAQYYSALIELVKAALDGNTEGVALEEAAREMLGIRAYPAYTLDKLVASAVRQLQQCASDPWCTRAVELARWGARFPAQYRRRAVHALRQHDTPFLVMLHGGDECKVTFEMLEAANEGRNSPLNNNDNSRLSPTNNQLAGSGRWYSDMFSRGELSLPGARLPNKPVFLKRNALTSHQYTSHTENVARSWCSAGGSERGRRKPRLHDLSDCTLNNTLRLLSSRQHSLYRSGCLTAARSSHQRLHAARRARFRAWLKEQRTGVTV